MKKIIVNIFFAFIVLFATSCEDYFDSVPSDTISMDKVFSSRILALEWLSNVYQYLPDETAQNYTGGEDETRGIWMPASLEGYLPWGHCNSHHVNSGTLYPSTGYVQNMWKAYYRGIQKANVYLKNIDRCKDMEEIVKLRTKAEARALRSIYYFNLFKIYGPVVIIEDEVFDNQDDVSTMLRARSSVDDYIKYILDEFDAILQDGDLFSHYNETDGSSYTIYPGNITNEIVRAVRSQVLFYAASHLYNGDPYYKDLVNPDGTHLFPQSRDNEKWRKAKAAAIDFINNEPFQLVFRDRANNLAASVENSCPYYSVSESFLGREDNEEMIFYSTRNDNNMEYCMRPRHEGIQDAHRGGGGLSVPLQTVDLFFTKNGLRIEDDPEYYNYTNEDEDKFNSSREMTSAEAYKDMYSGYTYFTPGTGYRIMKQFYNREPRFYIAFTFQNRRWDFDESKTYYTDFSYNGNSGGKGTHDYPKSGVLARKKLRKTGSVQYNIFIRLTEIYLNYAEACAELGEYQEAVEAINIIRTRAGVAAYGLNGESAPGYRGETRIPLASSDVLSAVRRERLIELAYENHHYFDVRRWGVAGMAQGDGWIYPAWHKGGEGGEMMGFNVLSDDADHPMYFYKKGAWETRIFSERMKLFPIPQNEINVNNRMVQNTGWTIEK